MVILGVRVKVLVGVGLIFVLVGVFVFVTDGVKDLVGVTVGVGSGVTGKGFLGQELFIHSP